MASLAFFWARVVKGDDPASCWTWTGSVKAGKGYGRVCLDQPEGTRRETQAHRVAYEQLVGPLPAKSILVPTCGNKLCVRPDHYTVAPDQCRPLPSTRTCVHCGLTKPCTPEYFHYRYPRTRLGNLDSWCRDCRREFRRQWGMRNQTGLRDAALSKRRDTRLAVLTHYSGGQPRCACCGEAEMTFLCLDHTDGGGNRHRKAIRKGGQSFYAWIIQHEFPTGYRVLCYNCNAALGFYGVCPHQTKGATTGVRTMAPDM